MAEYPRHLVHEQVLSCNSDMLRFAHGLGYEVQHVPDELSVVRVVKRLQAAAPQVHEGARSGGVFYFV